MIVVEDLDENIPLVVVFSDYNLLSRNVALRLLQEGYEVVVVTTDKDNWIRHDKNSFQIVSPDFLWLELIDKVDNIAVFLFDKKDIENYLNSSIILSEKSKAKTLIISSFSKLKSQHAFFKERALDVVYGKNVFAGIIYLAEIFERSFILKQILDSAVDNRLTIDPRQSHFLIKRIQAEDQILKSLLSLSVYGHSLVVTSLPISNKTLFKSMLKHNPDLKVDYQKTEGMVNHTADEKLILDFDLDHEIQQIIGKGGAAPTPNFSRQKIPQFKTYKKTKKTYKNLDQKDAKNVLKKQQKNQDKKRQQTDFNDRHNFRMKLYEGIKSSFVLKKRKQKIKKFVAFITSVFLFPVLLSLFSFVGNKAADYLGSSGNVGLATNSYRVSEGVAFVSQEYNRYLSLMPVVGKPFESSMLYASLLRRDSRASRASLQLLSDVAKLLKNSFDKQQNDMDSAIESMRLSLDSVYNDFGLLKGEIFSSDGIDRVLKEMIVGDLPTEKKMSKLISYKQLLEVLPDLLGDSEAVDYAILLVDNRIKRPGGGVVEAVAIMTFHQGNLSEVNYYDAAEMDKNLKGFASPPPLLSGDFEGFYLRDALWSSHFPESAAQVQWFLQKQTDRYVRGVFMVDIDTLGTILSATGPVNIDGEEVAGQALSAMLKLGSQDPLKTNDYFRELLTVAINRITQMQQDRLKDLLTLLESETDSRHLVLYFGGFSGIDKGSVLSTSISGKECNFENCLSDFLSVSELEISRGVAVNKQMDIAVSFEEGLLKRKLHVYYKNQSGLAGNQNYESKLVVSTPQETSFAPAIEIQDQQESSVEPDLLGYDTYKQAVFDINVAPGEVKAYTISWESGYQADFSDEGQYGLRIIKQPGEAGYPVNLVIEQPQDVSMYNRNFNLTKDGLLNYNTQLSEDLELIFNW